MSPFLWLVIAAAAAVGELLTTGLFLACIAVAAMASAILAIAFPWEVQVAVFAGASLAGLVVLRPLVIHGFGLDTYLTHSDPLIQPRIVGRKAIVTRPISATGGQIRIGEGEFWSARAFEPGGEIPAGETVEIMLVEGVTALVVPWTNPSLPENTVTTVNPTGEQS